jgi:hypothetical protein
MLVLRKDFRVEPILDSIKEEVAARAGVCGEEVQV